MRDQLNREEESEDITVNQRVWFLHGRSHHVLMSRISHTGSEPSKMPLELLLLYPLPPEVISCENRVRKGRSVPVLFKCFKSRKSAISTQQRNTVAAEGMWVQQEEERNKEKQKGGGKKQKYSSRRLWQLGKIGMKNKGLQHASVMRNSPVSKQICLSFSSWQGNFVRVIAPPSSPKLLLIPEFQFPPLHWRWVLTYFSLLSNKREREEENRDGELLG